MLPAVVFGCGLYLLFGKTPRPTASRMRRSRAQGRQWPQGLGLGFYTTA